MVNVVNFLKKKYLVKENKNKAVSTDDTESDLILETL